MSSHTQNLIKMLSSSVRAAVFGHEKEHKSNLLVNECENFGVGCNFQHTCERVTSCVVVFRVKYESLKFLKFSRKFNTNDFI